MSDGRPEWTPTAFIENILGDLPALTSNLEAVRFHEGQRNLNGDRAGEFYAKEASRQIGQIQDTLVLYLAEVRRLEAKRSGS